MIHSFPVQIRNTFEHYRTNWIRSSIQFTMNKEQDNRLSFLDVLITHTVQRFRSSVYRKPIFTVLYQNFNSHHQYNAKERNRSLSTTSTESHYSWQRCISRWNEEFRDNIHLEGITSSPINLDRTTENNTQKLITISLLYVKGLSEKIQKICSSYDIRTIFRSGTTIQKYLFQVKHNIYTIQTEYNKLKNCVYFIPCSYG